MKTKSLNINSYANKGKNMVYKKTYFKQVFFFALLVLLLTALGAEMLAVAWPAFNAAQTAFTANTYCKVNACNPPPAVAMASFILSVGVALLTVPLLALYSTLKYGKRPRGLGKWNNATA